METLPQPTNDRRTPAAAPRTTGPWMPRDYYQSLDAPYFDYQICRYAGLEPVGYRGPRHEGGPYVAYLGAAQTYGRFVEVPYPTLCGRRLGLGVVNFGLGAAGPRHFRRPEYRRWLAGAEAVVLQVLSGRSVSNSIVHNAWPQLLRDGRMETRRRSDGTHYKIWTLISDLLAQRDLDQVRKIVAECREDYMRHMLGLIDDLQRLGKRVVLLWLSFRDPAYELRFDDAAAVCSEFPQLVDEPMLERLERVATTSVRVRGEREEQRLWVADEPVAATIMRDGVLYNVYYPTPKMHLQAADAVTAALESVL